jgi:hypothetical protein
MIRGTVALPVWNSKAIAWLCMESLCRQFPPRDEWELIVFEEHHEEALGYKFFDGYRKRLDAAGCVKYGFMYANSKYSLSEKWVMIAKNASETSEYFCLCAADNYYSPYMLRDAEENIREAEWSVTPKGYFYDLKLDKIVRYELPGITGLQMTARTSMVISFPAEKINKGVDTWFSRQMGSKATIFYGNHWQNILCTNGLNNISTERQQLIRKCQSPFHETRMKLERIVPEDISKRLKILSRCLRSQ